MVSERAVHASLIDEQSARAVKWERLVETVATLPIENPPAAPLRSQMPKMEGHLRLGAVFIAAWRSPLPAEMAASIASASGDGIASASEADDEWSQVVLMVDVAASRLRLLEGGVEVTSIPVQALTSLYPGYRALHQRTESAESLTDLSANETSSGANRKASSYPFAADVYANAAAFASDSVTVSSGVPGNDAVPSQDCCFCLPGFGSMPMIPLHTDTPYERSILLRTVRAASLSRPLAPFPPLHVGLLKHERDRSSYITSSWTTEHAILLPEHLLLQESPEALYPHRVIPLHGTVAFLRSGEDSLVFSIKCNKWQLNFAARDRNGKQRWIEALSHVVPIGVLGEEGTLLSAPKRRPSYAAEAHDSLRAGLVRVRALQRELVDAESGLTDARDAAEARFGEACEAIEQLKSGPTTPSSQVKPFRRKRHSSGSRAAQAMISPDGAPSATAAASFPQAQLWQLLEVNRKLSNEIADGEKDIKMLQRAVVMLSTTDWAKGEWLWFAKVAEGRTLWEVWSRAHALHRQWQRAAAAAAAAAAERAAAAARNGAPVAAAVAAAPAIEGPSVLSAWQGERGLGIDDTNTASKETRRAAALAHDEDWFISFANRIFEL